MKNGNEKLKDKWIWVYGDECDFIWSHFNMSDRSDFDRMKLQFVEYKSEEAQALEREQEKYKSNE
jgi:hypothetical protein